jgi:hypothetical protein
MIIRPTDICDDSARARLGVGLAAEAQGVECDLRLTVLWRVNVGDRDRKAFIDLARECAETGKE